MLNILQPRLQQYVDRKLPEIQLVFRKGRGTIDHFANICWMIEKSREFQKKKKKKTCLLTAELRDDANFNERLLNSKIEIAIRDVMGKREYGNSHYTDKKILEELSTRYFSTITNLARYDYNQSGAEGQKNHSENSVSRTWYDRNKLLSDVHAFVKIF